MTNSNDKYRQVYIMRGIWELWHEKTWDDYIHENYKKEIKKLVKQEVQENVILNGNNGMGKTMLMNLAMKDFLHMGYDVYVLDFREFVKQYTLSWRGAGNWEALMNCDYLAIDDIGKEFKGSSDVSRDLAITALDVALRHRFQRKLSTWITSNLMLSEIKEIYGEHISSLMKRSSVSIAFEGEDYGDRLFKKITV